MRSKGVWGLHLWGDKNAVGSSGEVRFEVVNSNEEVGAQLPKRGRRAVDSIQKPFKANASPIINNDGLASA